MKSVSNTNLHIYPSNLLNESRIEKEVGSLIKLKIVEKVVFIGLECNGKPTIERVYPGLIFIRIKLATKNSNIKLIRYLMFLEFFFKATILALKLNYEILNVHSLHVLPIGFIIKVFRRKKVVYDAHELETEVSGSKGIVRFISKVIERFCIKFVDYTIVVSQSICDWYKKEYKIKNIKVIKNVPNLNDIAFEKSIFRGIYNIPNDHLIFIYQGLLSKTRGVNIILDAFVSLHNTNKHIVFLGTGPLEKEIYLETQKFNNIHLHPMVKSFELHKYTSGADVGIHMILNTCLNHYYCLPNKIFEYFLFGLPVIVSDFPEMKKLVIENGIGWCIKPEVKFLIDIIEKINFSNLQGFKENALINRKNFGWQIEELNYIEIYKFQNLP
jgi:glycosyltransferase involved in cell wall biosynthesis